MRIGIYLGRHAAGGGGIGVYARSLVKHAFRFMEQTGTSGHELVLYAAPEIFDAELLQEIHSSPVLSAEAGSGLFMGAGQYLRPLPNGARIRVLARILPAAGRQTGMLLDQLLVPLLALRDGIRLMHSAANSGLVMLGQPQVATVHDLYQAYPAGEQTESLRRTVWLLLKHGWYRLLFAWQFRRLVHVITDTTAVRNDIISRYRFDPVRISVIPLGVDESFIDFIKVLRHGPELETENRKWLSKHTLETGYILAFASSDPRKNMDRTIEAWLSLAEPGVLVLRGGDARAAQTALRAAKAAGKESNVKILPWLPRKEIPYLYWNARAVLVPTLAEGFGLPAVEALSLGRRVVCGPLEAVTSKRPAGLVFECRPDSAQSIAGALAQALANSAQPGAEGALTAQPRSIEDCFKDTFALYQTLLSAHR